VGKLGHRATILAARAALLEHKLEQGRCRRLRAGGGGAEHSGVACEGCSVAGVPRTNVSAKERASFYQLKSYNLLTGAADRC
jgi:hypothetical protein